MMPTPAADAGQHLVEGLEAERVEDDLHGRDVRASDGRQRLAQVSTLTP